MPTTLSGEKHALAYHDRAAPRISAALPNGKPGLLMTLDSLIPTRHKLSTKIAGALVGFLSLALVAISFYANNRAR